MGWCGLGSCGLFFEVGSVWFFLDERTIMFSNRSNCFDLTDPVHRDMLYVAITRAKSKLWFSLSTIPTGLLKYFLSQSNIPIEYNEK